MNSGNDEGAPGAVVGGKIPGKKPAVHQTPFHFARMLNKWDALDRLDLRFRWGRYGIKVLRCHLTWFESGFRIPPHKHSEYEFHFIPKGKGRVTLRDQPFDLHEGHLYLTGPEIVHAQESDRDDPMFELCLHCEIHELGPAAPSGEADGADWGGALEEEEARQCVEALNRVRHAPVMDLHHAMNWFLEAYRVWDEQPPGFYTLLKQAIIEILLRTARNYGEDSDRPGIPERDMNFHRYQLATQYIQDNEGMPITLEQVADIVRISPRQIQRIFRDEGRTTFRDYVEHVRLTRICAELIHTEKPIESIALDHGYANPTYLYPVFKSKFKLTPAAYRKAHREEQPAAINQLERGNGSA